MRSRTMRHQNGTEAHVGNPSVQQGQRLRQDEPAAGCVTNQPECKHCSSASTDVALQSCYNKRIYDTHDPSIHTCHWLECCASVCVLRVSLPNHSKITLLFAKTHFSTVVANTVNTMELLTQSIAITMN